jgi:hypothetical protein
MAMKASELRQSNKILLVLPSKERIERTVFGVIGDRIWFTENSSCGDASFEPIPLTEKWMVNFGMVTLDNEIDQIVWGFSGVQGEKICYVSDGFDQPLPIYFEYDSGVEDIRKELKYVHELQNLHFVLTGEELKKIK